MWNEILFLSQSIVVALFAGGALLGGLGALYAFTAVCWILGNLFVLKEATLFNLDVITSDSFAIGANLGITLLSNYYSEKEAQKAIYVGIYLAFFFLCVSQMLIWYIPNNHDFAHPHFFALFERMPRIVIVSFSVALMSMSLNLKLFDIFTKKWSALSFILRSMIALMIAQFFDTALFAILALHGQVASIINIICFSYLIKIISIIIVIPLLTLFQKLSSHKGS